jgi:hypothetical protein
MSSIDRPSSPPRSGLCTASASMPLSQALCGSAGAGKWAVAGRDRAKLEGLAASLLQATSGGVSAPGIVIADVADQDSLVAMARWVPLGWLACTKQGNHTLDCVLEAYRAKGRQRSGRAESTAAPPPPRLPWLQLLPGADQHSGPLPALGRAGGAGLRGGGHPLPGCVRGAR